MKAAAWVLVADSARARIFKTDSRLGPLLEVGNLVHGEGRLHRQDLVSDRDGRAFDTKGDGRHGMEAKTDPKKQEQISFIAEISQHLKAEHQAEQFHRLFLVAPPAMLGHLRDQLDASLKGSLVGSLDKNLVKLKPDDIRSHLPEKLWVFSPT